MANGSDHIVVEKLFSLIATEDRIDWHPLRDGVDIHYLYRTDAGAAAALLRYAPGASVPRHRHAGYEHILVLAGSQQDGNGSYGKGTLLISKPESTHQVVSAEGCIVLAIWEKPVEFLEAK